MSNQKFTSSKKYQGGDVAVVGNFSRLTDGNQVFIGGKKRFTLPTLLDDNFIEHVINLIEFRAVEKFTPILVELDSKFFVCRQRNIWHVGAPLFLFRGTHLFFSAKYFVK